MSAAHLFMVAKIPLQVYEIVINAAQYVVLNNNLALATDQISFMNYNLKTRDWDVII